MLLTNRLLLGSVIAEKSAVFGLNACFIPNACKVSTNFFLYSSLNLGSSILTLPSSKSFLHDSGGIR